MALYTPNEIRQLYDDYNYKRALNIPITKEFERQLKDAAVGVKNYSRELDTSLNQLKSSGIGLFNTFNDGKHGASVYNKSLRSGAELLATFLKALGPLGRVLGGLAKAGAEFVAQSNEQSDALFDSYTNLTKLGVGLSDGVDGVFKLGQQMGYSIKELEKLAGILTKSAQDLAMLSGTAEHGAKVLGNTVDGMRGYESEFRRLGISIQDVNTGAAGYLRMQSLTGRGQRQNLDQLSAGAREYIRQQQLIAKITGQNAELQMSADEQMLNNTVFQVTQRELRKRESAALARGDTDAAARLNRQFNENIKLIRMMPEDLRTGAMDLMAGYVSASQEAEQLNRLAPEAARRIRSGQFDATSTLDKASEEAGQNMNRFSNSLGKLGLMDNVFGTYAGMRDLELMSAKETVVERENTAKRELEDQKNVKGATAAYADVLVEQRRTREALEDFVNSGINPTTAAMRLLTSIADAVSGVSARAAGAPTPPTAAPGAARPAAAPLTLAPGTIQDKVRTYLAEQGITDPRAVANILAQIQAESNFNPRSEELGRYTAETLFRLYGPSQTRNRVRFQTLADAERTRAQGPEAVGNLLYGGRMGNAHDEGFKYRGRGLIQLTGKDNYQKYGRLINVDLVSNPNKANDLDTALKIAAVYFAKHQRKGVDLGNINDIGRAVGYAGGRSETARRANIAQNYLDTSNSAAPGQGYEFGGIAIGPESGFETTLHGDEIVAPMGATKAISVDVQGMSSAIKSQFDIMLSQSSKLDDLINIMRKRNQISEKILRAYQS